MSFTVTEVIREAREIYNGLSDTNALRHLNRVRSSVLSGLDLRKTSITINTVDGTQEYALASTSLKVDAVHYVRSATEGDFKVILPTSRDELDVMNPEWQRLQADEPQKFYLHVGVAGPVIGFVPASNLTTTGGYPFYRIYESQNEVLTSSSVIYDDLPNLLIYVYGIAKEHASRNDKANFPNWMAAYEMEMAAAQRYLFNKTAHNEGGRLFPGWKRPTGVV